MSQLDAIVAQLGTDQYITLELDSFAAFTLASAVQLACRHPSMNDQLRDVLVEVVNHIAIGFGGPVGDAIAAGWDEEQDVGEP